MAKLTNLERQIIEHGLRKNKSQRAIAKALSRDHSVVRREIARNSGDYLPYTADSAQRISKKTATIGIKWTIFVPRNHLPIYLQWRRALPIFISIFEAQATAATKTA